MTLEKVFHYTCCLYNIHQQFLTATYFFIDLNLSFSNKNEPLDLKSEFDSDVEVADEAVEAMTFEISSEHDTITNQVEISEEMKPEPSQPFISWIQNYWWSIGLPLCFILFLQLLPMPQWVIGFITGMYQIDSDAVL